MIAAIGCRVMAYGWICAVLLLAGCAGRPEGKALPWWAQSYANSVGDTVALGERICAEGERLAAEPERVHSVVAQLADTRILHPGEGGGGPVRVRDVAMAILDQAGCTVDGRDGDRPVVMITGCRRDGEWRRVHVIHATDADVARARRSCPMRIREGPVPTWGQAPLRK